MKDKNFKIGDEVYYLTSYGIRHCIVKEFYNTRVDNNVFKKYKCHLYDDHYVVFFDIPDNKLFHTEEEAKQEEERLLRKRIQRYKEQIKTVEDLLNFPFNHCIAYYPQDDYMDEAAQQAYRECTKELLNITL